MSSEEKSAWVMLVVSLAGYATYAVIVAAQAASVSVMETAWVTAMLWTIGGGIVAGIVLNMVWGMFSAKDAGRKDQRDRQITRFGDSIGQSFVVIGGVAALALAMVEADYFWIANVIYLAFVLSAFLGSIARLVAYRRGLPTW
ncbi:hypothetical protein L1277_001094 [Okibacterium sp. HSC-33S16]|uniref:hypothetical protein n=1 Tax=Okibacterium sp. HSC-33S16 TaxID=2910965 RepID=UPI00209E397F|nr:hypothetical protein [Okibacterium sp. HSC-33S16]MCP2031003.1 hypothetical protein [Okibacterium sp. HSC-33S16]